MGLVLSHPGTAHTLHKSVQWFPVYPCVSKSRMKPREVLNEYCLDIPETPV